MRSGKRGMVAAAVSTLFALLSSPSSTAQCDPEEVQKLTASNGAPFDRFGISSAIDGTTAVVGAYLHGGTGTAYVYELENGAWVEQQELIPATIGTGDWFGVSVAISGDRIVVGAQLDDDQGNDAGAAYIFHREASGAWVEEAKLTSAEFSASDWAGHSVALSGTLAVVSAQLDDGGAADAGAAYVFRYDGAAWQQEAVLRASDPGAGDEFGTSVATDGTVIVIGARRDNDAGADSGSAYVFRQDGGGIWQQEMKLTAVDAAAGDEFGFSVSVDGDFAAVGARLEDDAGTNAGAVYIFQHDGAGNWLHDGKLVPQSLVADDRFGEAVAVRNGLLLAEARQHDAQGSESGAAYLFRRQSNATWFEESRLLSSDGAAGDFFGISVGLDGQRAIVGANLDDDNGDQTGSAYIFNLNCASGGTPAELIDYTFVLGSHTAGVLADLAASDDSHLVGNSQFGFSVLEPNVIDLVVGATSTSADPMTFDVSVESRINHPSGTGVVRLKNWSTGQFEQVGTFATSQNDAIESFKGIETVDHVRASDHRIELSTRLIVIATFSATGFKAYFDWVEILVE